MREDKNAFYQRKPFGEKGIKDYGYKEKGKRKKRSMPSLKIVVWDIQNEQRLNKGRGQVGSASERSLPGSTTEPPYKKKEH
jgi:hypothetical protein